MVAYLFILFTLVILFYQERRANKMSEVDDRVNSMLSSLQRRRII